MKLLKSSYTNTDGVLTRKGHIEPQTDAQTLGDVQDGSQSHVSTNTAAATVATDPEKEDGDGFIVTWVGPGKFRIQSTADGDLGEGVKTITGESEEFENVDEAVSLKVVID